MDYPRIADVLAERGHQAGPYGAAARVLEERFPLFRDLLWLEANHASWHEHYFRPYRDVHCHVSKAVVGLGRSRARALDQVAHDFCSAVFYGNAVLYASQFNGLATHYNTCDPDQAQNAVNVLDGEGREPGQLFSIYLVSWHERGCQIRFAPGPTAGLLVEEDLEPPLFGIDAGLVIFDWQCCVRIANLDRRTVKRDTISDLLGQAMLRIRPLSPTIIYVGEAGYEILGKPGNFRGMPVREIAALRHDEHVVI